MTDKITEIFFYADEFCKEYYKVMEGHVLSDETSSFGYTPIMFWVAGADLQSAPLNRGSVIHSCLYKKNFHQPLFS